MRNTDDWFTEFSKESGSAFSLHIKKKLHCEQSRYQRIEIFDTTGFGRMMVLDGCIMLSDRDNFIYHEMLAHPALYTHPAPRRVAIIGGGDCGTLREVLRHPEVEVVTQIEIDEQVTRLAEIYFPELCEANTDPRAELRFGDGMEWIRLAEAGSLDLIIVDSTDPVGPAEVLFSEAFYRACLQALATGGLLALQSESPLIHNDIQQRMRLTLAAAGFQHQRCLLFPQCVYPSGWWSATLARKGAAIDGFRAADVNARDFVTRYYNSDIHRAAFAMPEFLGRQLQQ